MEMSVTSEYQEPEFRFIHFGRPITSCLTEVKGFRKNVSGTFYQPAGNNYPHSCFPVPGVFLVDLTYCTVVTGQPEVIIDPQNIYLEYFSL